MNQKLAKVNYDYCAETIELKNVLESQYLEFAGRLCKIKDEAMYAPNYETFEEFLEDLKVDRTVASRIMSVWRRFVVELKVKPKLITQAGGWSKVYEVMKYSTTKAEAIGWLEKLSAGIRRNDLRKELKEAETGIMMSTCKHKTTETITFCRCLECQDTWRLYDDKK